MVDYEEWIDYLRDNSPVSPDYARRTMQVNGLQSAYAAGGTVSFTLPRLDLTSLGVPPTTSVAATLVVGDDEIGLGDFPASGGSADIEFDLPTGASGTARIRIETAPNGATATLPAFEVAAPLATTTTATTEDHPTAKAPIDVDVRVTSDGSTPTGTRTLREGNRVLDEADLVDGSVVLTVATGALRRQPHPDGHLLRVTQP